jgi:hypothetical protein
MTGAREIEQHGERGNRRERRARHSRLARFGRGRRVITTALLRTSEIGQHPHADLFRRSAAYWKASTSPDCFLCNAVTSYPAAHLFGWTGSVPQKAAVAGLCCDCWRENDQDAIDVAASRLLRRIVPGGAFIDAREAQP